MSTGERKDALQSVRESVADATDRGQYLYAELLTESLRLAPDTDPAWSLYSTVLEAGERLLQDVAAGASHAAPWAWRVMQEQVSALREAAGLDAPDTREREVREKYGIPEPDSGVAVSWIG